MHFPLHFHSLQVSQVQFTDVVSPPTGGASITCNCYRYTDKLLALEARFPTSTTHSPIQGFLPIMTWGPMLASHPDQRFATFLRRCIEQGFRIRVLPSRVLHTHSTHLPSAASHSELISRYIVEEVWQAHLRHCLLVLRQSISAPSASSQNPISPRNSGL